MIKMLILVCSVGIPEEKCWRGQELFTMEGPRVESKWACEIFGNYVIEAPETFGLHYPHRTKASSFLRFKCVAEEAA